eukprot:TRINITY_DN12151_c0_g1_i1.p1 TRINITY_DN12151_c0_g1~~TRINITY_DN12151_c0_g1_i1.p1  ORF type:complete len:756 (+),score=74.36 TRINITY_DN12151_c0_g1_i1:139-2406(+)
MGKEAAHLVLVRGQPGSANALEVLLVKRSKNVTEACYGVPGGPLTCREAQWSRHRLAPKAICIAARVRGAVREAAERAGSGRGPDLVRVNFSAFISPECTLPSQAVPGAKLPASLVQLTLPDNLPPIIECQVGDCTHYFIFHKLEGLVAKEWLPRARSKVRWEIDEAFPGTKYGYTWVPLSRAGPLLHRAQLCSPLQALFESRCADFLSAVGHLAQSACSPSSQQVSHRSCDCIQVPLKDEEAGSHETLPKLVCRHIFGRCSERLSFEDSEKAMNWFASKSESAVFGDAGMASLETSASDSRELSECFSSENGNSSPRYTHVSDVPDILPSAARGRAANVTPFESVVSWLAERLAGFGCLTTRGREKWKVEEVQAAMKLEWLVDVEDVTDQARVRPFEDSVQLAALLRGEAAAPDTSSGCPSGVAPGRSILCFHGTSASACRQIAREGFKASKMSGVISIVGAYFTVEPAVALKYSRLRRPQDEHVETLSMLVFEVPAHGFQLRNGMWFQPKPDELDEAVASPTCVPLRTLCMMSTTFVCEDARALLPRAILTFRAPTFATSSATLGYDLGYASVGCGAALPSAVLFELDFVCWPFILATSSAGPPYTLSKGGTTVMDRDRQTVQLSKHLPAIFRMLHAAQVPVILCSCNNVPAWCIEFLRMCPLDPDESRGLTLLDVVHPASVVRPGCSKSQHFKEIQSALKLPFQDMLFFHDSDLDGAEGKRLGIRCVQGPPQRKGLTKDAFAAGLQLFSGRS